MSAPESETPSTANTLLELTTALVAAYVRKNAIRAADLPSLIEKVNAALVGIITIKNASLDTAPRPEPAVNPKKSVMPDYIVCLEDGKKFKSLKRHLTRTYGLTPQQYRERWNLDPSYPMVAPNYAAVRSELAKKLGLGRKTKATA